MFLRETINSFLYFFQIALTRGSFSLAIFNQKLHSLCPHSALTRPTWVKTRFLPRRHARGSILLKKQVGGGNRTSSKKRCVVGILGIG